MALITYSDKSNYQSSSLANEYKVTANDMNMIKNAINNATNYSTTEIVVGTRNGKPLYRKYLKHTYALGSTTDSFSSGLTNLDYVEIDANIYKYNGDWEKPYYASNSDWCRVFYRQKISGVENNTIEIRSASTSLTWDIYVTIEYTKTTD